MHRTPFVLGNAALILLILSACGSLSEHDRYAIEPYFANVYQTAPQYGDQLFHDGGPRRR